jgi:hypothetical protein
MSLGKFQKTIILTSLALLSLGRLWVERSLTQELREQELLPVKLDLTLRDEMGKEAFAAALGGMRSVLASYYELEAFTEFSKIPSNWHKVDQYYALCNRLMPLEPSYWETHAWMLFGNMSEDYASDGLASKGAEVEMRKLYRQKGLGILMKGLEFIPQSGQLNRAVADWYAFPHPTVNPTTKKRRSFI